MKFHHIGIAVTNIDTSVKYLLGEVKSITGKVYDGGQKATLQMFDYGGARIELIEGVAVEKILGNDAFKIYHVCIEVESLLDKIETARKSGYIQINPIMPAPLFDNRNVVFMMNNDGFIIEFLEAEKKEKVRL